MKIRGWHVMFLDVNSRLTLGHWELFSGTLHVDPVYYIYYILLLLLSILQSTSMHVEHDFIFIREHLPIGVV